MAIVFNRGSLAPIVGLAKEAGAADRRKEARARSERQVSQGQRERSATLRAREARAFQREQSETQRQQFLEDRDFSVGIASDRFRAELAVDLEKRTQATAVLERKRKLESLDELARVDIDAQKRLEAYEQKEGFEIFKDNLKRENDLVAEEAKRATDKLEFQVGMKSIREAQDTGFYTGPAAQRKMNQSLLKWAQQFDHLPEAARLLGIGVEGPETPSFSEERRETIAASELPELQADLFTDNPSAVSSFEPRTEAQFEQVVASLPADEARVYYDRWAGKFE